MALKLTLELETLSGTKQSVYSVNEPLLFRAALVNSGASAVTVPSIAARNGICSGVVRDGNRKILHRNPFLQLLISGHELQPPAPPADRQARTTMQPGGADEVRGDWLDLVNHRVLPPGDYTLEVECRAPALDLQSNGVNLRVVEPDYRQVSMVAHANAAWLDLAIVRASGGNFELRHERRSIREPETILSHGLLGSFPHPITAAVQQSQSPLSPGDRVWFGCVGGGKIWLQKSWSSTADGKPVQVSIGDLGEARAAGPILREGASLLVPVFGRSGSEQVIEVVSVNEATGAAVVHNRVSLGAGGLMTSEFVKLDSGSGAILIGAQNAGAVRLSYVRFPLDGDQVTRGDIGEIPGKLAALAIGPRGDLAAVIERAGTLMSVTARPPAYSLAPVRPLSPAVPGQVREIRLAVDDAGRACIVLASEEGAVFTGDIAAPLTVAARGLRWPAKGVITAGPVLYGAQSVSAWITADTGLQAQAVRR